MLIKTKIVERIGGKLNKTGINELIIAQRGDKGRHGFGDMLISHSRDNVDRV